MDPKQAKEIVLNTLVRSRTDVDNVVARMASVLVERFPGWLEMENGLPVEGLDAWAAGIVATLKAAGLQFTFHAAYDQFNRGYMIDLWLR